MLPDVSDVLAEWSLPYLVKTVTRGTVDFEPVDVVRGRTIQAVIQPAQKNKLNTDQIDWAKRYLLIHTNESVINGELIEYSGEDYKIIEPGNYQLYGYTEAIAEQTKRDLVAVTV